MSSLPFSVAASEAAVLIITIRHTLPDQTQMPSKRQWARVRSYCGALIDFIVITLSSSNKVI